MNPKSLKKKRPKLVAEFHTADGLRSVVYKNWEWPPAPVYYRPVFSTTLVYECFTNKVTPNPTISERKYALECTVSDKRGVRKVIYREVV